MCLCIEKGSWSPNNKKLTTKRLKCKKYEKCDITKPEWLKQWTISKGWMHDRSHMLSLGLEGNNKISKEQNDDSSVLPCADNTEDLISVNEKVDNSVTRDINNISDPNQTKVCIEDLDKIEVDETDVYSNININYRENFPIISNDTCQQQLKENVIQYSKIIFPSRQNLFQKSSKKISNIKTLNDLLVVSGGSVKDKRNSRLFNSAYFKRNVQDTIYECSEDSFSLYTNPIYEAVNEVSDNVHLLNGISNVETYFKFNKDAQCEYQKFLSNDLNTNKLLGKNGFVRRNQFLSKKSRFSSEKYIIRHIRIRIMLSLRLRKFQRVHRKKMKTKKKLFCLNKKRQVTSSESEDNLLKGSISRVHDEQRRISNGNTSLKIQNLR